MRTTLKRGIGRVNGLNGNGHSALPPLFGPITRYRQPVPPRRSAIALVWRGLCWLVLAVVVIGSGIGGGIYLYTHETLGSITATGAVAQSTKVLNPLPSTSQPAIALIAGYDHRAGMGTKSLVGSNSDTLMLVRADPTNHTLSLLSFPRDLWVNIYCHGDTVYTQSRINSAWSICGANGPAATVNTMQHLTHLNINYFITVDFHAFKQLVNRLHGVYMNVDRRYYIPPNSGTSAINLQPGYQKLNGGEALSFVRFRHFDNDIYRTGRQQLFMEALKSRLRSSLSTSSLLTEVPKLIHVLKGNLEVAKAGGGPPSISEVLAYIGVMYHLPPGHLFRNSIPYQDFHFFTTAGGADVEDVPPSAITAAVQSFLHPDVRVGEAVGNQYLGRKKKPTKKHKRHPLSKSAISILVLNAGHTPGEASNTSYLLTKHGYTTKSLPDGTAANAPQVQRNTTVYYNPVLPDAQQAAGQIKSLFGADSHVAEMTTEIATFAREAGNPLTVVTVGTSFPGKLTLPHREKLPPKVPPQVSPGVSVTASALRSVRGKAHFPLKVPHLIAQYSTLSQQEGVRAFRPLKHKHEVVLTFQLPSGVQYWQIEETDWTSAPILANPTAQFLYHHQKFLVYTTGGAIQMIALRTPKAVYMVVNTILNQLTNATMVSIAKNLEPIGH
jgi:LCP family protein required for cell wall assembly